MKQQWWHGKVAYQIYPKSFYDSNGDGIGDLPGIIEKLDYLKELGIDIVWISPIYQSPLADQGYDISDYYKIDPRFGTMEDMERLIAEAKKRELYILMDLVVNHCSDEHEWFQKAIRDPHGTYGNFFYITEKKEGELPCNWRSYFGGPVWEELPGHPDLQYLHLFHKKQPDLNWENPQVRREVFRNILWWMKKGLAGFRIDAIINIKKALPFHDYPADRADGLSSMRQMLADASGIGAFLGELRDTVFAPTNAFTVGEVFDAREDELDDFIGDGGYFSSMFDFSGTVYGRSDRGWFASKAVLTPDEYRSCIFSAQKKAGKIGMLSNIIENHDEPRGVSRYLLPEARNEASKKLLAGVLFLLKGLPFVFQGQEIGMENLPVRPLQEIDDVSSIDEYHAARAAGLTREEALKAVAQFSRDNARSPMQWSGEPHAGFTSGTPWLAVHPNYRMINVEKQRNDPASLWNYYRKLIALRKNPEYQNTIVYGEFAPYLEEESNLIAFTRRADRTLLVLANLQAKQRTVALPAPVKKIVLANLEDRKIAEGIRSVTLQPYEYLLLELCAAGGV